MAQRGTSSKGRGGRRKPPLLSHQYSAIVRANGPTSVCAASSITTSTSSVTSMKSTTMTTSTVTVSCASIQSHPIPTATNTTNTTTTTSSTSTSNANIGTAHNLQKFQKLHRMERQDSYDCDSVVSDARTDQTTDSDVSSYYTPSHSSDAPLKFTHSHPYAWATSSDSKFNNNNNNYNYPSVGRNNNYMPSKQNASHTDLRIDVTSMQFTSNRVKKCKRPQKAQNVPNVQNVEHVHDINVSVKLHYNHGPSAPAPADHAQSAQYPTYAGSPVTPCKRPMAPNVTAKQRKQPQHAKQTKMAQNVSQASKMTVSTPSTPMTPMTPMSSGAPGSQDYHSCDASAASDACDACDRSEDAYDLDASDIEDDREQEVLNPAAKGKNVCYDIMTLLDARPRSALLTLQDDVWVTDESVDNKRNIFEVFRTVTTRDAQKILQQVEDLCTPYANLKRERRVDAFDTGRKEITKPHEPAAPKRRFGLKNKSPRQKLQSKVNMMLNAASPENADKMETKLWEALFPPLEAKEPEEQEEQPQVMQTEKDGMDLKEIFETEQERFEFVAGLVVSKAATQPLNAPLYAKFLTGFMTRGDDIGLQSTQMRNRVIQECQKQYEQARNNYACGGMGKEDIDEEALLKMKDSYVNACKMVAVFAVLDVCALFVVVKGLFASLVTRIEKFDVKEGDVEAMCQVLAIVGTKIDRFGKKSYCQGMSACLDAMERATGPECLDSARCSCLVKNAKDLRDKERRRYEWEMGNIRNIHNMRTRAASDATAGGGATRRSERSCTSPSAFAGRAGCASHGQFGASSPRGNWVQKGRMQSYGNKNNNNNNNINKNNYNYSSNGSSNNDRRWDGGNRSHSGHGSGRARGGFSSYRGGGKRRYGQHKRYSSKQ